MILAIHGVERGRPNLDREREFASTGVHAKSRREPLITIINDGYRRSTLAAPTTARIRRLQIVVPTRVRDSLADLLDAAVDPALVVVSLSRQQVRKNPSRF